MTIDPKRAKEIFLEAAELPEEAARAAYLDKACGGDTGLRARVEALLRSHDPDGSFLGTPAAVVDVGRASQPVPDGLGSPSYTDPSATQAFTGNPDPGVAVAPAVSGENGSSHDEPLTFLAPPTRPDALGRLGHYEVLQVLGRGGFGIVFRAFDEMLQRVVALKVMAPQLAATSPARKRFLREARSSAQVRHENVVQVHEIAEQPLPYLVMEFIPGETLQQKLDRLGPLDVPEVLRIGRQIAEGLAAAHAMDLIHRDIKPGNVLLEGGQQKVKITDFGLARTADDASISQSGILAGTPMYMAPEQAEGQPLDQRADLFSLGSVLYQMVAGRPPFRANSAVAVLKRVAEDKPRAIREIIPEAPQWLCDIIAKLHAKNPDDRYQSAREVADVLADCETQLKANAKLTDFSRIPDAKPVPPRHRRRWKRAAAALALVLLIGGVWFGRSAMLYMANRGELELLPQEGLSGEIVLYNYEGVFNGNKLPAQATDWLDIKKSHILKLPPGRYQLNVRTRPTGGSMSRLEVTTSGPFGSNHRVVLVMDSSAIVTVARGERVSLRALMFTTKPSPPMIHSLTAIAPFTAADVQRIAALPAAQQVEEVRKELVRRNPGFDGKIEHKIEDGVVTAFRVVTDQVMDIAPIRVFNTLRLLECKGTWTNSKSSGLLANLTPLKGMNLADLMHLDLSHTKVTDAGLAHFKDCETLTYLDLGSTRVSDAGLIHFKECKNLTVLFLYWTNVGDAGLVHFRDCQNLTRLNLVGTKVSDMGLAHFKDCKNLTHLEFNHTQVGDAGFAHFKTLPLKSLGINDTGITDLTPLQGMPLEDIRLTPKNITRGLDILRAMKSLKTIGNEWNQAWPAAEFWQRYDKGEFK